MRDEPTTTEQLLRDIAEHDPLVYAASRDVDRSQIVAALQLDPLDRLARAFEAAATIRAFRRPER